MYSLLHSAYFLLISVPGIIAHDFPVLVPTYKTFHAIDCYVDNLEQRALRSFVAQSTTLTVEQCLDICLAGNFTLGGVENGDECYCGDAILYNPPPNTDNLAACTVSCTGSVVEACGGPFNIQIYQNGNMTFTIGDAQLIPSYKTWTAGGCFEDTVAARHIPTQLPLSTASMTIAKCLDGCSTAKFNVAGLQFGEECYCGNVTIPAGLGDAAADDECNMPCTGNATELCGAANRNLVYSLPSAILNAA